MSRPSREAISPDDLRVFGAVARERGVRGAAAALDVPRSTVSRQLARLEAATGARLVTRTTRHFALTELGAALAERCAELDALLTAARDLVERDRREPSGVLRVTASPLVGSEFLPEVIAEYLARHPRVRLDLHLSTDYVDLRGAGLDVAIRTGPLADASDQFAVRLGTSVTGCYASPAYLAARGTPSTPGDLAGHDCLVVGGGHRATWRFHSPRGVVPVVVTGRLRVDSFDVVCECAARGAGVMRTARFYAEPHVQAGRLVPILVRYAPRVTLYAVHTAARPVPPKVRAFVDLVRAMVRRRLEA